MTETLLIGTYSFNTKTQNQMKVKSFSQMRPAKAQTNLCNRTVTPEPSLLVSSMDSDESRDQIFDVWLLEGMLV